MKNTTVTLLLSTLAFLGFVNYVNSTPESDAFRTSLFSDMHHVNRRSPSFRDQREPIYPGQLSYEYMDNEPFKEALKRSIHLDAREFIKKSLADSKSLRFHQCYFNPISCFR